MTPPSQTPCFNCGVSVTSPQSPLHSHGYVFVTCHRHRVSLSPHHCHPPTVTLSLSRCNYHLVSVVVSLLRRLCYPATVAMFLSLCLCHPVTYFMEFLSPCHCHPLSIALSPFYCHKDVFVTILLSWGVSVIPSLSPVIITGNVSVILSPLPCYRHGVSVMVSLSLCHCHGVSHNVTVTLLAVTRCLFHPVTATLPPSRCLCLPVTYFMLSLSPYHPVIMSL